MVVEHLDPLEPASRRRIRRRRDFVSLLFAAACLLSGCKRDVASDRPIGTPLKIQPPLGLPALSIPRDNPPTAETIALGRRIFYDRHLSKDDSLSCASCHDPHTAFSNGLPVSKGFGGASGVRNSPTILNAAYLPLQFWDGRALSLEQQAASPIADPVEMNQKHDVSVSKLNRDPAYAALTTRAFGSPTLNLDRVEKALASFERTLLSGNSAFDRFQYGGDKTALSPAQIRGLAIFQDPHRGNCAVCHTIHTHDALFTDGKFHNLGIGLRDDGSFSDVGRYHQSKQLTDTGAFRTPTLRNVERTAPYMHDGSLKTLRAVVDFYAGGGNSNPYLDKELARIKLTAAERSDLVDFLTSLNGTLPENAGPPAKD